MCNLHVALESACIIIVDLHVSNPGCHYHRIRSTENLYKFDFKPLCFLLPSLIFWFPKKSLYSEVPHEITLPPPYMYVYFFTVYDKWCCVLSPSICPPSPLSLAGCVKWAAMESVFLACCRCSYSTLATAALKIGLCGPSPLHRTLSVYCPSPPRRYMYMYMY